MNRSETIKMNCKEIEYKGEIGWDGGDWSNLAQDRDQWRDLVNTVMNPLLL
jgi:hypothetical protein